MKIEFCSKEESKRMQEKAFLALSPAERVSSFFRMMEQLRFFQQKKPIEKENNFVIVIKKNNGKLE